MPTESFVIAILMANSELKDRLSKKTQLKLSTMCREMST